MAIINLGDNVKNEFDIVRRKLNTSSLNREEVLKILDKYLDNMYYTEAGYIFGETPYGVQAFMGDSPLGLELAKELEKQGAEGKVIMLMDVLNPFAIPTIKRIQNKNESGFCGNKALKLMEDENFFVGMFLEEDKIHLYFFKK